MKLQLSVFLFLSACLALCSAATLRIKRDHHAVSFQEQANPNYCQWDPRELNGGYSLRGGGHTFSECEQSCIERGDNCQMFTYFHETGYCHQFETCKNSSKISRHGAKMYIKRKMYFIASGKCRKCK